MRVRYFLYNTFLLEHDDKKIAIDPGGMFFYHLKPTTLIPKSEWSDITHILITHGDPDHYWHADRIARASGAAVVCNRNMVCTDGGQPLLLGPRSKGLKFDTAMDNVHTLTVDETIKVDGLRITGVKTTHGELVLRFGPISRTMHPGPAERVGWGAIGFDIECGDKRLVNLGDTLLQASEWQKYAGPDLLMLPIGGRTVHNTMDEDDALAAIDILKPKMVIPCHYNCPAFFTEKFNAANDDYFRNEAEKRGVKCAILNSGDGVEI